MDIKSEKPKLTVSEQIQHMKDCGITFKNISEEAAEQYLTNHTYYFKLKAYSKNYEQRQISSARKGTYICLDFSYLQDLARLDMYFREIVFKITVDIEHLLKVQLLSNSQKNVQDDGYQIVDDFLSQHSVIRENIEKHAYSGYSSAVIQKYQSCYPIWVFLEIISFGDLIEFYKFYNSKFPIGNNVSNYLWSARILRNAAAHNSCILNRLSEKYNDDKNINNTLMIVLKRNYHSLAPSKVKQYLLNPVIQDLLDILILLKKLDKGGSLLSKRTKEINHFMRRCRKNASYYKTNNILLSSYKFVYTFLQEYEKS